MAKKKKYFDAKKRIVFGYPKILIHLKIEKFALRLIPFNRYINDIHSLIGKKLHIVQCMNRHVTCYVFIIYRAIGKVTAFRQ